MRGVGNMAYSIFVELTPPSLRDTSPYILFANKTQGRSVNTFDNRSEVMHLPLPFAVLHSITGCSRKGIERKCHLGESVNPYS